MFRQAEKIKTGRFIYPYLTCQAYFNSGVFIGCGIARTIDVFDVVDLGNKRRANNAEFLVVPFKSVNGIYEVQM